VNRDLGPRAKPVYEYVRAAILNGEYPPGTRLPSHSELATSFDVATMTVRAALARLEEQHLIVREQGRGTFVRPAPNTNALIEDITQRKRMEEAESALLASEQHESAILEAAPDAIISIDHLGTIVDFNPAAERIFGHVRDDVIGREMAEVIIPPSLRARHRNGLSRYVRSGDGSILGQRLELTGMRADGTEFPVELTVTRIAAGGLPKFTGFLRDITERKRAEQELRESEEQYRRLVEVSPDAIAVHSDGKLVYVNPAAVRLLGATSPDELVNKPVLEIVHPDDRVWVAERVRRTMAMGGTNEPAVQRLVRLDGQTIHAEVAAVPIMYAGRPAGQIMIRDATERKQFEEQLRHQALHDVLTGLANRTLLQDRLQQLLAAAHRKNTTFALLLLDLDRFKDINDAFGHHAGDELLRELGTRFLTGLRESDTIARLGGDEFALLLPDTDTAGAVRTAEKVLTTLTQPFELEGQRLDVGASIGIVLYPQHGTDSTALLQHADLAMYTAKRSNLGYAIYETGQDQQSLRKIALASALRRAIEENQLVLHYQPKVSVPTGQVSGVEALVRWQHPEFGLVPPLEFIPLAEHTGLIRPLTRWVLNEAVRQCGVWRAAGIELQVAVNLSARSLHDQQIVDTIAEVLNIWSASPSWLAIEITEGAVMADPQRALDILTRLHAMGVGISIDDFGTGYSSLAYLDRLPAAEIKIDRSFVMDMVENESHWRIVRGTVDIGHGLDLKVVAEGVEDQQALDRLANIGCDVAQGYYLSRPISAADLLQWLESHQAQPFRTAS
jgi:diguanylate cyclase